MGQMILWCFKFKYKTRTVFLCIFLSFDDLIVRNWNISLISLEGIHLLKGQTTDCLEMTFLNII